MARVVAVLRLMLQLTGRNLRSLSSVGLNNLFLCVAFLMRGSHSPRTAFFVALPFLLVLLIPLLFAVSADALELVPEVRAKLLPLTASERWITGLLGLMLSPGFWLLGVVFAAWAGFAVGVFFVALSAAIQALVFFALRAAHGQSWFGPLRYVPRFPGKLGGIAQASLRQMLSSLDFYTALSISVAGTVYRFAASKSKPEAMPILAMLVALALSTYAQRMFGLESAGSLERYHLLPVAGWKILLVKDLVYLGVVAVLALPLGMVPALTFGLMAVSLGRFPSLRQNVRQRRWRFPSGDVRFGVLQIVLGGLAAMGSVRVSLWFLFGAAAVYFASLGMGGVWWERMRNRS